MFTMNPHPTVRPAKRGPSGVVVLWAVWSFVFGALFGGLSVGAMLADRDRDTSTTSSGPSSVSSSWSPTPGTTTIAVKPAPPPLSTDGTFLVGTDVVPGRYRTAGPVPDARECYWKRLASLDSSDIIDNEGSSGPQVVDIFPSDTAFSTSDCQPWQKIG